MPVGTKIESQMHRALQYLRVPWGTPLYPRGTVGVPQGYAQETPGYPGVPQVPQHPGGTPVLPPGYWPWALAPALAPGLPRGHPGGTLGVPLELEYARVPGTLALVVLPRGYFCWEIPRGT